MYVPPASLPSKEVEASWTPQSGFNEYLRATAVESVVSSGIGDIARNAEIWLGEFEESGEVAPLQHPYENVKDRNSLRDDGRNLKRLTRTEWKESQYYREGMEYENNMSETRLRIYSEYNDAKKRREDIIRRRNVDFWSLENAAGFLAGTLASSVSPENFLTFGVGGTLTKKIGLGIAENVTAEVLLNLSTQRSRAAAGIAPTKEEFLRNTAYAAVIGGIFSAVGHGLKKTVAWAKERKDGNIEATKREENVNVANMTDDVDQRLSVQQKAKILMGLQDSFGDATKMKVSQKLDLEVENQKVPDYLDPQQVAMHRIYAGDEEGARELLESVNQKLSKSMEEQLFPSKNPEPDYDGKTEAQRQEEYTTKSEEQRYGVADEDNIDITHIEGDPEGDTNLLVKDRLYDEATEIANVIEEQGLPKAYEVAEKLNCG